MQAATRQRYQFYLEAFREFCQEQGWVVDPADAATFDQHLQDFLHDKYFDGEHSSFGNCCMAAVIWKYPQFGRHGSVGLPLSHQSLKGWRKLAPSMTRLPMSDALVSTIAMRVALRHRGMGLALCVMRATYFRPGEVFRLKCRNLVRLSGGLLWALTLHDFDPDDPRPSKTGEFDESSVLDLPRWHWLGPALAAMIRGRKLDDQMFQFSALDLTREMQRVSRIDLGVLPPPVLYMWRHTAASVEFLEQARTLAEVKRRGRWKCDASVRRYEKAGRVGEEFARLEPSIQAYLRLCHPLLRQVLCGERPLPALPRRSA